MHDRCARGWAVEEIAALKDQVMLVEMRSLLAALAKDKTHVKLLVLGRLGGEVLDVLERLLELGGSLAAHFCYDLRGGCKR